MISRSTSLRSVVSLAASILALASATSCGGKDLGANLGMTFTPSKSYLLPGTGASCLDAYNSTLTGTPVSSISQYRVVFPAFSLSWSSSELLYVAFINLTFRGSNFSGGSAVVKLTNTDIEPILGIDAGAAFNGVLYPTFSGQPKTISTAVSRTTTSGITYPACGFTAGGLALLDEKKAFAGQILIELVGFSMASDGTQSPVRKNMNLTFEYVP